MTPDQRRLAHLQDVYKLRDPEQCDTAFLLGLLDEAKKTLELVTELLPVPEHLQDDEWYEKEKQVNEALSKIRGGK